MPEATKKVPVFVLVLNSIRSAEMRLSPDTNTTLPDGCHAVDIGEELGLVGKELDVVALNLDVLDQQVVVRVDRSSRIAARTSHLQLHPPSSARLRARRTGSRGKRERRTKKTSTNHAVRGSGGTRGIIEEYHGPATPGPVRSGRSTRHDDRPAVPRTRADARRSDRRPPRRSGRARGAERRQLLGRHRRADSAPSCRRPTPPPAQRRQHLATALSRIAPNTSVTPAGAASRR